MKAVIVTVIFLGEVVYFSKEVTISIRFLVINFLLALH